MLLLEGIATIFCGLWLISQGTEPGQSILAIVGLPVVAFGIVLTIVGFGRALREDGPDDSRPDRGRLSKGHDSAAGPLPFGERIIPENSPGNDGRRVGHEPRAGQQHARKSACPECGSDYGFIERLTQPIMCSGCWKKHDERSML